MIALDTEDTGVDHWHGAKPFLVTSCGEDGKVRWWEWDVDPTTRQPSIPADDLAEIRFSVESRLSERLVLQNGKFDAHALRTILPGLEWPWEDCDDTLVAGHLLHSGQRHDLTSMVLMWLGKDIQPFEDRMQEAVNKARALVRKLAKSEPEFMRWRLAKEGLPDMPSAKGGGKKTERGAESEKPWKFDCWLPRALAKRLEYPELDQACDHKSDPRVSMTDTWGKDNLCAKCGGHLWWFVTCEYANADSSSTLALWKAQWAEIEQQGLGRLYRERMKLPGILDRMEERGATCSDVVARQLLEEFGARSERHALECLAVAERLGADLDLPKGLGINKSLRAFCFETLKLPAVVKTDTGAPSLDKEAMAIYKQTLDLDSDAGRFVTHLLHKRGFDSSLGYVNSYRRYGRPVSGAPSMRVLHPSFNGTGTVGLRLSCSNPNGQNIPQRDPDDDEGSAGKTVRWMFGPAPGREWWSMDYENIELRIPAFESGEPAMIELFERPDEAPCFGSYHLLNCSILYPDLFGPLAGIKGEFKKRYGRTNYHWGKGAGLALIYGCGERTFDRAARKAGAYAEVRRRLPRLFACADRWIAFANKHGHVLTMPDRDVGRGFPVECLRSEWGRVSPTEPFNYHIQPTAGQCINKAMTRCEPMLLEWERASGKPHFIALQVHDELVFDLPAGGSANLPKVRALKLAMEESGEDIGVPLKVSVSWHPRNWGEAVDPVKGVVAA